MKDTVIARWIIPLSHAIENNVLGLSASNEQETSALTREDLRQLVADCFHVGLAGRHGEDGFLIALDETSSYRSPNYLWFKARFEHFVYVDRIIVSPLSRGSGVGRALYEQLFRHMIERGDCFIGCEVNVEPPNPISEAFHAALGFHEIGRATLPNSKKDVCYLCRAIRQSDPLPT